MKYALVTFGCRVNQADSLRLEEDLRASGAEEAASADADLVIVNTCSVTATADQGARQTIRRIARENPRARIVATGCYATRCEEDVAALPNVVRVVRNDEKLTFLRDAGPERPGLHVVPAGPERPGLQVVPAGPERPGLHVVPAGPERPGLQLRRADLSGPPHVLSGPPSGPCGKAIEPGIAGRTAFTIRAQTGCEERCAFCIIPKTRGASRSLPIDVLVGEVRRVAAAGFKEVAIAGVHLGSYGRDLGPRASLLGLLRALDAVDADVTYRISSLEPMDCTRPIVDLVAGSGRFLPHFHLPLQHASDRVLAAMRRPYTLDYYRRLVDAIHARLPHVAIGSDMLVGFPGETDEDFARNLAYLPSSPLTHLHVFPYSDRPGTEATQFRHKVPPAVIRDRGAELRRIGGELAARFRASQIGTVRPGLTLEDGTLVVTDNYLKVKVPAGLRRNIRVRVRIAASESGLTGVIEPAGA
jgi:threonylcarbamoyladenosine tRNA methylthiotransferase MtaB